MIISYFHKNITAWSSTHGNREGGGRSQVCLEKGVGWLLLTPATLLREANAPPTAAAHGQPRSSYAARRSGGLKIRVLCMLESGKRGILLRRLGSPISSDTGQVVFVGLDWTTHVQKRTSEKSYCAWSKVTQRVDTGQVVFTTGLDAGNAGETD